MTREDALARIKPHEAELRAAGIAALYMFGSTARGTHREGSDLDLMCDIDPAKPMGLFQFASLQLRLQDALHVPVDLVPRRSMLPGVLKQAEAEMVQVF
jgi:predicted nucleotidyltransferase